MQIYSNADLTLLPVPFKQMTLGALSTGFTVTNYSDVAFNVRSNTQGDLGTIPPYFARTFGAKASDTIQFEPSDLQTAALPQTIMFLNVDETSGGIVPSQTALAQVPGYALDVQGNVSISSGNVNAVIQGTPTVQVLGTIEANIQNATLQSTITNAYLGVKAVASDIQYTGTKTIANVSNSTVLIPPDNTLNLKEFHFDLVNTGASSIGCWVLMGSSTSGYRIVSTTVPANNGQQHFDLTFGTGIPLDQGIYATATGTATTLSVAGGYAIVESK